MWYQRQVMPTVLQLDSASLRPNADGATNSRELAIGSTTTGEAATTDASLVAISCSAGLTHANATPAVADNDYASTSTRFFHT